jgi:putative oxidoreductase
MNIMKQLSIFFQTEMHLHGLLTRIALGLVILAHGCQMLLGWFGGYGYEGTMNYLTQNEGLPWLVSFAVILLEFFGSLAILFGFMGRFFGLAMTGLFIGMIFTSHLSHGLFMNWSGSQSGEGYEYHILAIALSMNLLISGSGSYSVDRLIMRKLQPSIV